MEERIWRNAQCSYKRVFAQRVGLKPRGVSARLRRALSDFGSEHSFARAAERFREHYGFEINTSALRKATLQSACRAQEQLEAHYAQDYRALPDPGVPQVLAEADGTLIRLLDPDAPADTRTLSWKEMRLTAAQAVGSAQTHYSAGLAEVDQIGRQLGHGAKDAGRGLRSEIHCVADGAEWIKIQCDQVFGEEATFLCDFYHVSQYLAQAAPTCRPNAPKQWMRTQQKRLKRGALQKVLDELGAHLETSQTPDPDAPVRVAHRYLENRQECLDYPGALERQLPIGSGLIESGHRHVLQARLKIPGAAWLPENAHAMAQLRVIRANGQWQSLWN